MERAESNSAVSASSPRSKSTGRVPQSAPAKHHSRPSTHERAMQSVRRDTAPSPLTVRAPSMDITSASHPRQSSSSQQKRTSSASPGPSRNTSLAPSTHDIRKSSATLASRGDTTNARSTNSRRATKDSSNNSAKQPVNNNHNDGGAIVTPELLVDALSGHEDGLLAIAEKLMEHYDAGYDVMGEAIIDAFADVQKLFQHVVEAAHMEGAAFEANRKEAEIAELRLAAANAIPVLVDSPVNANGSPGPPRHDEFIDQDVKDILNDAIRKGAVLRDANRHSECYELFEHSCQNASSLLPVDSDHRGRLQLSIARAESMSPDRACAILRYAMDDVLRSGLRAGRTPLPDVSKRADVVFSRSSASGGAVVVQSSDEALASLMEEMKEILSAPVYADTPLQGVTLRFWTALMEAQKTQQRNEERLEQNLAKLKGDFLLARAVCRCCCCRCCLSFY
jgi:hypothetical protein